MARRKSSSTANFDTSYAYLEKSSFGNTENKVGRNTYPSGSEVLIWQEDVVGFHIDCRDDEEGIRRRFRVAVQQRLAHAHSPGFDLRTPLCRQ